MTIQVEEALLAAQQEREQRLAMKKELDAVKNAEHLSSLTDMLMGLERLGEVSTSAVLAWIPGITWLILEGAGTCSAV